MKPAVGAPWTPEEIALLKELHGKLYSTEAIAEALYQRLGSRRTACAVRVKFMHLGIKRPRRRWSVEMEEFLFANWGVYTVAAVTRRLNSTFGTSLKQTAVSQRAHELRLRASDATGDLTLTDAAAILGITKSRMSRLAKEGKVTTYGRGRSRYVTPEDVERLKASCYTEPPESHISTAEAGRRLGYSIDAIVPRCRNGTLRAWWYRGHWRVSEAHVAELIAARRAATPPPLPARPKTERSAS